MTVSIDKKYSLLKPTIIVAFCTLCSRLSGLVRELCIAAYFGTSIKADSINIAIKLPNLFRRIFGEGALSLAFVPILNKQRLISPVLALEFAGNVFWALLLVLSLLTITLEYFAADIIALLAPGFSILPEKFTLTVWLSRITLPYLILVCLVAVCGGILNSIGKFAAFAFTPVILNLVTIAALYFCTDIAAEIAFSLAMPIAGFLQLGFMIVCLKLNGISFACKIPKIDQNLKIMLKEMVPATVSAGTSQLSLFISQIIASLLPGAISILSYAERLYQIPLSLVGTSISTVLLPVLSKMYGSDASEASAILVKALKWGLLLSLPCAIGMSVLAIPIIELIYQHGAFTYADTILTARVVQGLCLGIPAFVLNKIFGAAFYADKRGTVLAHLNIVYLVINTLLSIIFTWQFKLAGLAFAAAIAGWCNIFMLFIASKRLSIISSFSSLLIASYKICLCASTMGICTYYFYTLLRASLHSYTILLKLSVLTTSIIFGIVLYIILLALNNIVSFRHLKVNL